MKPETKAQLDRLLSALASLTPASATHNPGIGAGMLNYLIEEAQRIQEQLEKESK